MDEIPSSQPSRGPTSRSARLAIVALGIVLGQVVLYGPSLSGEKILLPLDLLAQPRWYLPLTRETRAIVPHNTILSDLVLTVEPRRQFAAAELREGRIPLWNPHNFAGSPTADLYSPFDLIYYAFPFPVLLAWLQLLKSLVAGIGAYAFFRAALRTSFWPAAIGGVCYPVTGFLVLWQGYTLSHSVAFLPWILLASDRTIRNPRGWGPPSLALLVGIVLSAEVGTTGQMLLTAGIYSLWCTHDEYGWRPSLRPVARSLATAAAAVGLGAMLAMPPILPLAEYLTTGVRSVDRAKGREERPPVGLSALPQTVLPDMYGTWAGGGRRIVSGNRPESSAAAYAGLIATLVLAPLALLARRPGRPRPWLWPALWILGVGWAIHLPGLVQLLRMPGLNMLSHNRFVFLASFAVLALAVLGLDRLERGTIERRQWFLAVIVLLLGVGAWCLYRGFVPPEPLASEWTTRIMRGPTPAQMRTIASLEAAISSFAADSLRAALLCVVGIAIMVAIYLRRTRAWMVPAIGALMLADLLGFAYGVAPQSDRELAYPDIPALSEVAALPGRALCVGCLPPALNRRFALRDVRGYDGVDPVRMIELLEAVGDPSVPAAPYARTFWYTPKWIEQQADAVHIPPVLDMLGVRYLVRRGNPPRDVEPLIRSLGYWVSENPRALPSIFVPRRVVTLADSSARLSRLAADDFDPRELAVVEVESGLHGLAVGSATIRHETPQHVVVTLDMQTPGLVVLSDLWDVGWKARIDGRPVPILRTNHAVRGVVAPAGRSTLEFRYESGSFRLGLTLMALSMLCLAAWCAALAWRGRGPRARGEATEAPRS